MLATYDGAPSHLNVRKRFYLRWFGGAWRVYILIGDQKRPLEHNNPVAGALTLNGACNWIWLDCDMPPLRRSGRTVKAETLSEAIEISRNRAEYVHNHPDVFHG